MPYTAVVPILLLAVRWVAQKLANIGLLPDSVLKMLQITPQASGAGGAIEDSANKETKLPAVAPGASVIRELESSDDWEAITAENDYTIAKFTADWCGPCKRIHPLFDQLASYYTSKFSSSGRKLAFTLVDVDEHDEIANKYSIAMMPTFLVLTKGGALKDTYRGSNEAELREFLASSLK